MSGQIFRKRTHSARFYKSFPHVGRRVRCISSERTTKRNRYAFWKQDGVLFPIEVKKTASPKPKKDARNLNAIDPVTFDDVPVELRAFKREVG